MASLFALALSSVSLGHGTPAQADHSGHTKQTQAKKKTSMHQEHSKKSSRHEEMRSCCKHGCSCCCSCDKESGKQKKTSSGGSTHAAGPVSGPPHPRDIHSGGPIPITGQGDLVSGPLTGTITLSFTTANPYYVPDGFPVYIGYKDLAAPFSTQFTPVITSSSTGKFFPDTSDYKNFTVTFPAAVLGAHAGQNLIFELILPCDTGYGVAFYLRGFAAAAPSDAKKTSKQK
ncbi:MAG: hypothetical protein JSS72_07000 [Armatimonadetes bacterium]|nr:hypothetical protein [Armatimonadota bacterium]